MLLQALINGGCNVKKLRHLLKHRPPGANSFIVTTENIPPYQNGIICIKKLNKGRQVIFLSSPGGGTIAFANSPDLYHWAPEIPDFINEINQHLEGIK